MDPLLLALVAAFAPAVAWLFFFYSRDTHEREPLHSVLLFFGLGAVMAVPLGLILIPLVVVPVIQFLDIGTADLIGVFIVFFLLAGLPEEAIKAGVAVFRARRDAELDEPVDGMIYFTSVGLGFGALETALYILGAYAQLLPEVGEGTAFGLALGSTAIPRAISATVAHGLWSGIVGYYYSRHVGRGPRTSWVIPGVGIAAVAHALYNTFTIEAFVVSLGVLVGTAVLYGTLLRRALEDSPHRRSLTPRTDRNDR